MEYKNLSFHPQDKLPELPLDPETFYVIRVVGPKENYGIDRVREVTASVIDLSNVAVYVDTKGSRSLEQFSEIFKRFWANNKIHRFALTNGFGGYLLK